MYVYISKHHYHMFFSTLRKEHYRRTVCGYSSLSEKFLFILGGWFFFRLEIEGNVCGTIDKHTLYYRALKSLT
jgi:hypothetical protein